MSSLIWEIIDGIVRQVTLLDIVRVCGLYLPRIVLNDYYDSPAAPFALRNPHGLLTACQLGDRVPQYLLWLLITKDVVGFVIGFARACRPNLVSGPILSVPAYMPNSSPATERKEKTTDAFGEC
jgi:hypothetical protein